MFTVFSKKKKNIEGKRERKKEREIKHLAIKMRYNLAVRCSRSSYMYFPLFGHPVHEPYLLKKSFFFTKNKYKLSIRVR